MFGDIRLFEDNLMDELMVPSDHSSAAPTNLCRVPKSALPAFDQGKRRSVEGDAASVCPIKQRKYSTMFGKFRLSSNRKETKQYTNFLGSSGVLIIREKFLFLVLF